MASLVGPARPTNPAFQAYGLLRLGFTLAPVLAGLDKFFNWMVYWPKYLAPWVDAIFPGSAQQFMYVVGVIEIIAGLVVALLPWIGGYLVAAWLAGIIVNLLTLAPPQYYDIALRDLGLLLGALTLGRLAWAFAGPAAKKTGSAREKTPA